MKSPKRRAQRIADRPTKNKVSEQINKGKYVPENNQDTYAGSEEVMLNFVVEIILKTIEKRVGL